MKQLHPNAKWLFFFRSFSFGVWIYGIIFFLPFYIGFQEALYVYNKFQAYFFVAVLTLPLILYIIGCYIWAILSLKYYKYELRDDGFRKEHGVIYKKYVTIPYDRIQNVDINRGLIARFLGLSDVQVQTAGGITAGSYGAFSEGRLPGVSKGDAEVIRDELIRRAKQSKNQGL